MAKRKPRTATDPDAYVWHVDAGLWGPTVHWWFGSSRIALAEVWWAYPTGDGLYHWQRYPRSTPDQTREIGVEATLDAAYHAAVASTLAARQSDSP